MKSMPVRWDARKRKAQNAVREARASVKRAEVMVLDRARALAVQTFNSPDDVRCKELLGKLANAAVELRQADRRMEERESMVLRGHFPEDGKSS